MTDDIGYQALFQAAKRGVLKEALKIAASDNGLPGNHHFYISFRTRAPGVKMAEHLLSRFPEEMTIVIQHSFWDLTVSENHFEIDLSFDDILERLRIPFASLRGFFDPHVKFGVQFDSEYLEAANDNDLVEVADALGDMLYILCGTILEHGMQYKIEEVFEEIQRSNMSKLGEDGEPIYREDGKVLKGPNYFKPNIKEILEKS